jgi:hypothetical protein
MRGLRSVRTKNKAGKEAKPKILPGRCHTNQDKGIILSYCEEHNLKHAGDRELRAIEAELHRRTNNHHKSCLSYIASVLRAAGTPVEYAEHEDPIIQSANRDHQELHQKGLLQLRNLECALTSLQTVDALYRQYREVSDRLGTSLARERVAKAERRAMGMAENARLGPAKRREKREIAQWFRVWLEVPDLFYDWIEMRQNSREFQRLFPNFNGRSGHHAGKRSFSI